MQWKPLDTAPLGKTIIVGRHAWGGDEFTTVFWKDEKTKASDLKNWMGPPTHWLDGIPSPPEAV